MGIEVSRLQRQLRDSDDASKEALDAIVELAKTKLDCFSANISKDTVDTKLIPIQKELDRWNYVQCYDQREYRMIYPALTTAVRDFSNGPIATGFVNLGAHVIRKMADASAKDSIGTKEYAISVDGSTLSRIDQYYFYYKFRSQPLSRIATGIIAVCVVKSAIDTKNLDTEIYRMLTYSCFRGSSMAELKSIQAYVESIMAPKTQATIQVQSMNKGEGSSDDPPTVASVSPAASAHTGDSSLSESMSAAASVPTVAPVSSLTIAANLEDKRKDVSTGDDTVTPENGDNN